MNRSQLRALASDAFHQVLDNGVFRVLAVLCALPVLLTFVLGIREEGLVLLFGVKTWSYEEVFGAFTRGVPVLPPDPQGLVIEGVLQVVLDFLAGSLGMLVALSATSFFVPRLLEKGSAELYFHKPVSRTVLFLSRYFAGLLFVGLVSLLLVGGMYLGLLVVSGHGDAGILIAALTLTYSFAPIYAFTQLAGVVTRSTVASLLLSSFFFLFNGCIHQGWIAVQQSTLGPSQRLVRERAAEAEPGTETRGTDDSPAAEAGEKQDAGPSSTAQFFLDLLDGLHFVLPKTTDADAFGRRLRQALARPLFADEQALVTVARLPEGLAPLPVTALAPGEELRLGEPLLAAEGQGTRHSLWRRAAERGETHIGERVRVRIESASQAAKTLEKELEQRPDVRALARTGESFGSGSGDGSIDGTLLTWVQGEGESARTRALLGFKGTQDETLFTLFVDSPGELAPEAAAAERKRLASQLYIDRISAEDWYPRQLGFGAPLRFNILFSIGTTLAFVVALLCLGAWRLARIEF